MLKEFLKLLSLKPEHVDFEDTLSVIDQHYDFTPTHFRNGDVSNKAGENIGSCKIFAFAQLHNLSEEQTLICFGRFYNHVKTNPKGNDHKNIRQFIRKGWSGLYIDGEPLRLKRI